MMATTAAIVALRRATQRSNARAALVAYATPALLSRRPRSTLSNPGAGLYSYGEGYLGSLGTGSYDSVDLPTLLSSTTDLSIKEISAGWAHAGFLTHDGDAYVYGRTHSFRDVIRATNMQRIAPWLLAALNSFTKRSDIDTLLPMKLELPEGERVKKMVCSTALTLLLTESGKLFTIGANAYGQCGNGEESVRVASPTHIVLGEGESVVDIAAGYQHGLAVTEAGNVFAWGKGERGQLGFGSANVSRPQEILALKNRQIVSVDAGFSHSTAVTREGEIFVWGKLLNPNGKADGGEGDQVIPRLLKTKEPVRLSACSHFHTTFLTVDDKLWLVGRTPSGRKEQGDRLVQVSSEMHTDPFQLANTCSELQLNTVHKLGKGVDNTTLLTKDGRAFEWTYTGGIQRVAATATGFGKVHSMESGFRYRLMLADGK